MAGLDWLTARPIAHRGLHDAESGVIENTLAAVAAAIEAGYAIEIDLRAAAGFEPVVFHDATLERLTTGSGPVDTLTPAELSAIAFRQTRERIPSLGALLRLVAGRVPLVIEVKTDGTGMHAFCERIARTIAGYDGPLAVMSFDPHAVNAFQRLAPELPRGIIAESFRKWRPRGTTPAARFSMRHLLHAGRTRPHFIAYCVDDLPAVAPLALNRLCGLPLLAWTVRTAEQRRRAGRWADQMIFEGFRA